MLELNSNGYPIRYDPDAPLAEQLKSTRKTAIAERRAVERLLRIDAMTWANQLDPNLETLRGIEKLREVYSSWCDTVEYLSG